MWSSASCTDRFMSSGGAGGTTTSTAKPTTARGELRVVRANDDDGARHATAGPRGKHVLDQRPAAQREQQLGRAHPLAAAGGGNDRRSCETCRQRNAARDAN